MDRILKRGRLLMQRRAPSVGGALHRSGAFLFVSVIILLPFLWVWGQGRVLYDFDMTFITVPIENLFARYERAGQLPLWAPELQGGYPLIAISHLGFFYPLHAVLRMVLPGVLTLNVSLAVHALLGAAGMYLTLRKEGYRSISSALGALVFSGTGFFVGHLYLTNVLLPLMWVPLQLWLLGQWLRERSFPALLGLPVAGALQILLGQPQASLIGSVAVALYAFTHLFLSPRRTVLRFLLLLPAAAFTIALAYAQIRPTLDLIPYTDRADAIPVNELYEFSFPLHHVVSWVFRHGFGYQETYIGQKNETELSSQFGLSILLLSGCGLLALGRHHARSLLFAVLLLGVSILMAGGTTSPFYRFLVEHQWITSFAVPARWIFLTVIGMSFLAARGLEALLGSSATTRRRLIGASAILASGLLIVSWQRMPPDTLLHVRENMNAHPVQTLVPLLAGLAIVSAGLRVTPRAGFLLLLVTAGELLAPNITPNPSVPFPQAFHRTRAEEILQRNEPQPRLFTQLELSITPPPIVQPVQLKRLDKSFIVQQRFKSSATEVRGIQLRVHWGKARPSYGQVLITVQDLETKQERYRVLSSLNIVDQEWLTLLFPPFRKVEDHTFLLTISNTHDTPGPWVFFARFADNPHGGDFLPGGSLTICKHDGCRPPQLTHLSIEEADLLLQPIYPESERLRLSQEILSPHTAASKGFASAQWLGALQLREVKRYLYTIGDQNENAAEHNPFLQKHRDMVDRLNIGYLIGKYRPGRTIGPLGGVELLQETFQASHDVRLYRNLQAYPRAHFAKNIVSVTHSDAALGALQSNTVPRDVVIVQDDTQVKDIPLTLGLVSYVSARPTEVVLRTHNEGTGFLVLRDTFFPGWEADVDGTTTRIYPTDMIFRGVLVPPGEHTVRFRYVPQATLRAVRISAAAWLAALVVGLMLLLLHYRRKGLLPRSFSA